MFLVHVLIQYLLTNLSIVGLPLAFSLRMFSKQGLSQDSFSKSNNVMEDRNNSPAVDEDQEAKELVIGRVIHRILEPINQMRTRVYQLR